MAPRKRTQANKGLEPNLYVRKKGGKEYFEYRRPDNGKTTGFGTDKIRAQAAAKQLNAHFMKGQDLVAAALGVANQTITWLCEAFQRDMIDNHPELADRTKRERVYRLNRIARELGATLVARLTTMQCADFLDQLEGDSHKQHRNVLDQLMNYAISKGHRQTNPVTPTLKRKLGVKKARQRLSAEQFKAIRDLADPWFQVAMDLALVLCQGRNEVANLKFSDERDPGVLYIVRQKVQKHETSRIAVAVSPALREILTRAKALPPLSPYVIHKALRTGRRGAIKPEMLTREFAKLRDQTNLFEKLAPEQRPSFHEIRGLGGHILEQAGKDKTEIQKLMAHATAGMTEVYLAGHQEKWVSAQAGDVKLW